MASRILEISPVSYSRTLIFNPIPLSRLLAKSAAPGRIRKTQLRHFSSKPRINRTVSPYGVGAVFHQGKRSFRGSVVAMATPGSVRKSEEEWQAILSPEQFRILRQKGTEYDT